jgi:hypothetical protein
MKQKGFIRITKIKLAIFISIFTLVALFLNGWRVSNNLDAETKLLEKQRFEEQKKLEPVQTFFKLQKALQENNQKEIQSLTAPPFQQYVTNELSSDYQNAEVTEIVKGDEDDYMVVIREVHSGYTSGSSVRVRNINGSWKITHSPACHPLPTDCGDKYDSDKREYVSAAQPKNIIDNISLLVFGVIAGTLAIIYILGIVFITKG